MEKELKEDASPATLAYVEKRLPGPSAQAWTLTLFTPSPLPLCAPLHLPHALQTS